jgi:N-acetylneuraminic acid mutarotase
VARATAAKAPKPVSVRVAYHRLFSLPAPLRDPASATIAPGRFVLLGGLDASDVSTAEIDVVSLRRVLHGYTLPLAQHDAQAAALDGKVYVFGGGSLSELDHILSFDPATGAVRQVGRLPQSQSDVAVAALGQTAYIVGGYNGVDWLNTILAWRPGSAVRVVGHLPVGLRYSAVAVADGRLVVIGGSTPTRASRAIYSFDPATGTVRQIGRLPRPITHASAATLGSTVYLIGGRGDLDNAQTAAVWAIDPHTGRVRPAGRLPTPLSDSGVRSVGGRIIVVGGLERSGATASTVAELVPAP